MGVVMAAGVTNIVMGAVMVAGVTEQQNV
jgi:hypothetical protein